MRNPTLQVDQTTELDDRTVSVRSNVNFNLVSFHKQSENHCLEIVRKTCFRFRCEFQDGAGVCQIIWEGNCGGQVESLKAGLPKKQQSCLKLQRRLLWDWWRRMVRGGEEVRRWLKLVRREREMRVRVRQVSSSAWEWLVACLELPDLLRPGESWSCWCDAGWCEMEVRENLGRVRERRNRKKGKRRKEGGWSERWLVVSGRLQGENATEIWNENDNCMRMRGQIPLAW